MDLAAVVSISQVIATIVVTVALVVSIRQTRHMQRQLLHSERAQLAQGTIELMKFLMTPEVKDAERICRGLRGKPYKAWAERDREALTTLCNALDVAGIFIRSGFSDEKTIIDSWGALIRDTYELAIPHIQRARQRYNTPMYWDDFEWLAQRPGIQGKPNVI
jgi:hypothetical protein